MNPWRITGWVSLAALSLVLLASSPPKAQACVYVSTPCDALMRLGLDIVDCDYEMTDEGGYGYAVLSLAGQREAFVWDSRGRHGFTFEPSLVPGGGGASGAERMERAQVAQEERWAISRRYSWWWPRYDDAFIPQVAEGGMVLTLAEPLVDSCVVQGWTRGGSSAPARRGWST